MLMIEPRKRATLREVLASAFLCPQPPSLPSALRQRVQQQPPIINQWSDDADITDETPVYRGGTALITSGETYDDDIEDEDVSYRSCLPFHQSAITMKALPCEAEHADLPCAPCPCPPLVIKRQPAFSQFS